MSRNKLIILNLSARKLISIFIIIWCVEGKTLFTHNTIEQKEKKKNKQHQREKNRRH